MSEPKQQDGYYRQGVIDAYNYVVDELGFELFDTNLLERLGVTPLPGELSGDIDCPNHGGAYDCTPFCELCAGNQVVAG
jgi:hypothetical protein